ncbi:hypothetical protein KP509_26G048300 [Ceratopteris richardii]|uniref:Pentatricopeptide repeat-containing protein n=1 Tax=Ceratopteris richardii TaxID=49495 RepID=A0A8T2RNB4_CERRI|nr:hypothetical protein KP509_26G048300 [Ceratopteris richardii]
MICRNINITEFGSVEPTTSKSIPLTLISSLRGCVGTKELQCCHCIHSEIVENGFDSDAELVKHLVRVYAVSGAFEDASFLFARAPVHNAGLFTTFLQEWARNSKDPSIYHLFDQMQHEGFLPSRVAYISILSTCAAHKDLVQGKRIHSKILWSSRFDGDAILCTALMNMYGKCRSFQESENIFDGLVSRDVVTWTTMISIHANHGRNLEAFQVFLQMQQVKSEANASTLATVLKACASLGYLDTGQVIHGLIYENCFELHIICLNALINLYCKCGFIEDAKRLFDSMPTKDIGTWNAIISLYTSHNEDVEALTHFVTIFETSLIPNSITFISILPICKSKETLLVGEWLNSLILDLDLDGDPIVRNAILAMYCKCHCLEKAQELFNEMKSQDVVSWNTLISASSQQGDGSMAFRQLEQMQYEGVYFDKITFALYLSLCASHQMLRAGKQVHVSILNQKLEGDPAIGSALLSMYSRCCDSRHAWITLKTMPVQDILSYNAVVDMLCQQGNIGHALQIFEQLLQEGLLPNEPTFVSIISTCATLCRLTAGKRMHTYVQSSHFRLNTSIINVLLLLYSRAGKWVDAWWLFETASGRDRVSWNTMLTSSTCQGRWHEAINMFNQMQMEAELPDKITFLGVFSACGCLPNVKEGLKMHASIHCTELHEDVCVGNALVSMYGKCHRFEFAKYIFNELIHSKSNSVTTWNAMISVYTSQARGPDAILVFQQMMQCGEFPTLLTYVSILSACVSSISLAEGTMIHARSQYSGLKTLIPVENALINMYGKLGDMNSAQKVFDSMAVRDLISWTTIISNYAQHGQISEALCHYKEMRSKGLFPNDITMLSMLNGYSHAGLMDSSFGLLMEKGGVSLSLTDHFVSIMDLLVKAGQLDEANHLIKVIPFEPTMEMYMTLLSGYRQNIDIGGAEYAAMKILEFDSHNTAAHIIMSSIYMGCDVL